MPESRYHWSGEEVNAIVSIWSDEAIQRALRSSDSEYRGAAKVYHEIFVRLRKLGYKGTVQQCRDKLKKLKGQYKEIKANSSDRWSYFPPSWFDAMDAVLGQRHRKPVLRSRKATGSQKNDKSPSSWTPDEPPQTSGSGVRTSASRLLELTDSSEDYEESGYRWSPKEVQALLTLWADKRVQKHLLSYKNEHVYAKFSSELAVLGFKRTTKQCRQKIQVLKKEYKKIKDNNNMSGSIYREESWFAIIDSVLCHQPSTLESGVLNSDARLLESPDSQQEMGDFNKSPSSWTPDEDHVQQSEASGFGEINATTLLFESTPDSAVDEEHTEESGYRWSPKEVQALLTLWADKRVQKHLLSYKNEHVYAKFSSELAVLGFKRTTKQCRDKLKKLKQEYRRVKDDNNKSGSNHRGERWFAIIDSVLCHQPSTLESGVINSDAKLLESTQPDSPQEVEDSDKSSSIWTPDEVHGLLGHQPGTLGAEVIHSATMLLESTQPDSPVVEEHSEESGYHWSSKEVQALLTHWADGSVQKQLLSYKNEHVYAKLSSALAAIGCNRTSKQCRDKLKKLKQEYKKIKDNKSGSNHRGERWFAIIDSVLCHQPSTLESGVIYSDAKLLESTQPDSPQEIEDSDQSASSWTPDEVHGLLGHQPGTSGAEVIHSATMLLESTQPDSPVVEEHSEKSGYSWTSQEVHALLTLWADESVQEQLLAYKNEHVYATFSSELAVLGFKKTSRQCRDKLKKLRQEYRIIKFDHNKSGSNHHRERWFAIMDRVLCHQPSTLVSGVINSEAKLLESPDSQQEMEDSEQSSSSWTPDEVHSLFGHQPGTSGAEVIHSATMLLESTQSDYPQEVEDYEESGYRWTVQEVHTLLTLWADERVQKQLLSYKNEHVYAKFSSEFAALGFNRTSKQCREKLKKLKQEYRKLKDDDNMSGSIYLEESCFAIIDSVLTHQTKTQAYSLPGAEDSGPSLTLSSLRLLAPPLRLMSAFMWQVAQQHIVKHYGKLEEFVTLVTEMVPELLSSRQRTQLLLGLRARLVLELCRNESTADLVTIQPHLDKIHYLTEYAVHKESNDDELEAAESNFVELVQTLLEDPSEREHFFQEVLPVHYGPRYDTALQVLVWEFLSRLEELLPVPDFTQTAAWLGAAASVLEECGKTIFDAEGLKTLLQHHQHQGNLKKSYFSYYTADTILSTLSLPPTIRVVISSEQVVSDKTRSCSDGDECFKNGTERVGDGEEREGPSNGGREEEEEDRQTEENWENKDYNERNEENMYLEQQEQINVLPAETSDLCIPVPSNGLNSDMSSQVLACSLCPFSHSDMAKLHQHIRIRHRGEDRKLLRSKESGTEKHLPSSSTKLHQRIRTRHQRKNWKRLNTKESGTDNSHPTRSTKLLHQHIRTKHQGDERKRQHSEESGTENLPSSTNKIPYRPNNMTLSCPHCGNVYQNLNSLKKHIRIHTFPFCCNQCERRFSTRLGLKRHQRAHTGERPFKCSHCDRRFMCAYSLKMHVRTHTGERPYSCTICGKTSVQHLARHMRMHAGEKNYLCSICGKAFLSSGELRLHTRSHTGECPYTCEHCGRGFKAACHLQIHIRRFHTGERPYPCTLCTKRFVILRELKRHMLIHTGEKAHQCSKCGKSFSLKETLKTHLKSHGF